MHRWIRKDKKGWTAMTIQNVKKSLMSTEAVHGRSEQDLLLPCDNQTTQASPRPRASSQEACQPRGTETTATSIQISPSDTNRRSIGQRYSVLNGGLQYSYIRKYQTSGDSALTVRCSRLHMSRAGLLFGSISGDNNSSAITGEPVPRH